MQYFKIRNWENFQHYKDRNPPWIKLYNSLLEDYEFSMLSDNSKLHIMLIWMLASRSENRLPFDADWIKSKIGVKSKVNLDELLQYRYIEKISNENNSLDDASIMLADCKQVAIPEREGETEREQRESQIPYQEFADAYNNYFADNVESRGHLAGLNDERKRRIKELWNYDKKHTDENKRTNNLEYWKRYFEYCSTVPFLNGTKQGSDYKADFDMLVKTKTYLKNLEGGYE